MKKTLNNEVYEKSVSSSEEGRECVVEKINPFPVCAPVEISPFSEGVTLAPLHFVSSSPRGCFLDQNEMGEVLNIIDNDTTFT